MKYKLIHLPSLFTVAVFVIMAIAFTGCNNDDDMKSFRSIEGEWISANGDIYYQFLSDGTGRYICLADEPGYNPEYPDAAIIKPEDPSYFDYTVDGDILTMKDYYDGENKDDCTIYVYQFIVSKDVFQMKEIRYSNDGINWMDVNYGWETYNRWTRRK